ncbi:AI-2E family transporter [Candidatus Uhrbacteria bacterium]|jgi:predicted PurR-regulated permease PerM|nr:AI-2E family transporter [Candidatus Uhrbacteria bacterium]
MVTKGGPVKINISSWTIVKALLILALAALLFFLRDVVLLLLVSLLIAALIDPFADWMAERKLPRGLAVLIVYLGVSLFASIVLLLVVPSVVQESSALLAKYAPYVEDTAILNAFGDQINTVLANPDLTTVLETVRQSGLTDAFPEVVSFIFSIFGGFLTAILILVLAFYFVVEEEALKRGFSSISPKKYRAQVRKILSKGRTRIGHWLRAQLLLMLVIFVITYSILTLLGVPFALVLALVAAMLEIIPFVGPILAAIPAILIAFSISPIQAAFVAISYFLLQQLEGDYLTPKIMQKVAGLNPIASIVAVIVGFQVAGVVGALIAIPVTMVLGVLWQEWLLVYEK